MRRLEELQSIPASTFRTSERLLGFPASSPDGALGNCEAPSQRLMTPCRQLKNLQNCFSFIPPGLQSHG